jgi:putative ABC transport system substrate-binding protein
VAVAQPAGKIPRIGVLAIAPAAPLMDAWREALREGGYVEGQNIVIEYRFARGRDELYPDFAAELLRLNVDLIVAVTTPAALAAKRATSNIPIVFSAVGADPIAIGLVTSLARPGGNITGLSLLAPALTAKRLELFRQAIPSGSQFALFMNPTIPGLARQVSDARTAADALGVSLQLVEVRHPDDLEGAFAAVVGQGSQGFLILPDGVSFTHQRRIIELADRHRLPAMYWTKEFVEAGGLMAYAPQPAEVFRRPAYYVAKILKGEAGGPFGRRAHQV